MSNEDRTTNDNLIEFRLKKLEEAVSSLSNLEKIVAKWDLRMTEAGSFLQCPVHKASIDALHIKVTKLEEIVTDLDRFKWKAVGVLSVMMLLVQLFGNTLTDSLFKKHNFPEPIQVQWVMPPNINTNTNTK